MSEITRRLHLHDQRAMANVTISAVHERGKWRDVQHLVGRVITLL